MRKFLRENFEVLALLITGLVMFFTGYAVAPITGAKIIVNTTGLERQAALNLKLDQVLGVLIDELYEEKEARSVCEETVDRWAHDARTRQEVKNEARRLKERAKKKGAKK